MYHKYTLWPTTSTLLDLLHIEHWTTPIFDQLDPFSQYVQLSLIIIWRLQPTRPLALWTPSFIINSILINLLDCFKHLEQPSIFLWCVVHTFQNCHICLTHIYQYLYDTDKYKIIIIRVSWVGQSTMDNHYLWSGLM